MAEAVMLRLGAAIRRQRAHDVVYDAAQSAATTGPPFRPLLSADDTVHSHLSPEAIDALLDPTEYTGLCSRFAHDGASQARSVAAAIDARVAPRARLQQ